MAFAITLEAGTISFTMLVSYLTLYFVVEKAIRIVFKSRYPGFYNRLVGERRDIAYFAFVIGIILNLFATPACFKALRASQSSDLPGDASLAGQMCIASKGVLWVSELNRLDHSNGYIIHHLSSISYLIYHIQVGLPVRVLYAFYVSLTTELFSNSACIAAYHDLKAATSPLVYRIQAVNTMLLLCVRIPPIIYASKFLTAQPISNPIFWINAASLFIYGRFIVNTIIGAATRLQLIQLVLQRPAQIRIVQRYHVSVYGFFFAVASFVTGLIAASIYLHDGRNGTNISQVHVQILITGLASLLGARLPAVLAMKEPRNLLSNIIFTQNGLWFQGALSTGTLSVLLSPLVHRSQFFLSLAIALPVGEAIGRIGCFFAGCCGVPTKARTMPIQLIATLLNLLIATSMFILYATNYISLVKAGAVSIILNAMIRLLLRPNLFAFFHLLVGIVFFTADFDQRLDSSDGLLSDKVVVENLNARLLWNPWTIVLATAASSAGGYAQGCASRMESLNLIQGCDNMNLGLTQGCSTRSETSQGRDGAESLGISQGRASVAAAQVAREAQDHASRKEAETETGPTAQGCDGGGSGGLSLVQGCAHNSEVTLREVNKPSRLI